MPQQSRHTKRDIFEGDPSFTSVMIATVAVSLSILLLASNTIGSDHLAGRMAIGAGAIAANGGSTTNAIDRIVGYSPCLP